MRTEYMMRTRESKQDKQRVEVERDNALIRIEVLNQEKIELLQQLSNCRREGFEALLMREEDVDARRPGVFSELAKTAAANQSFRQAGSCAHRTAAMSIAKNELFGLSFEFVLNFAIDFELIPSFMDRVSLKHLHTEVAGLLKAYFTLHDKDPPSGADAETLKKVAFGMVLARLALELFCTKPGYETPERQITGLLQWLDNSPGREKIMRKAGMPLVIRFSRQLYAVRA
ncbi:hypothetical protein PF008_g3535 [Phytophthora fragariae]|uniref:Uncharacterized protein n=1 Tax=Phytophthora fragariae TaxID=53985 RepID=A0A6A3FS92_9STRA|nr:hypothetical protein PF009_g1450 [Phytophthora fragariae]KAE9356599.1 hypothetical protein PF008_g3535 [Phytophthora fragariae]